MDLNNESSAFRNTDPGFIASNFFLDYQASLRDDNLVQPDAQFSLVSMSGEYGDQSDSFPSKGKRPSGVLTPEPISGWGESMVGFEQLHEEEFDVYMQALHDLQIFTGEHAEHIRMAAVEALASLGERAPIEPLNLALKDPFWNVRAAAVQALATFEARTPIDNLITMLEQEKDESVRETIIHTLGQRMPINALIQVLRFDENWMPRQAAAAVLGKFKASLAIKWLITALKNDKDESVRATSAKSLGMSGKRSVKKALSEALLDPDEEVRDAALEAIAHLEGVVVEESTRMADSLSPRSLELHPSKERATADSIPHSDAMQAQDTQPEVTHLAERAIRDLLIFQEEDEHVATYNASPIWQEPWKEQVIRLLANFLRDKRGYVSQPRIVRTAERPTLLLTCFYQHSSMLREVVLHALQQATSIESVNTALKKEDEIIGQALEHTFELLGERTWIDLLIVSMDLSRRTSRAMPGMAPLRVVVSGMSGNKVRRDDTSVLDQIVVAWMKTLQEPPVCQHPEDITDVKVWYQPAPGYVL